MNNQLLMNNQGCANKGFSQRLRITAWRQRRHRDAEPQNRSACLKHRASRHISDGDGSRRMGCHLVSMTRQSPTAVLVSTTLPVLQVPLRFRQPTSRSTTPQPLPGLRAPARKRKARWSLRIPATSAFTTNALVMSGVGAGQHKSFHGHQ